MTYIPERDITNLISRIKPAAHFLRRCVLEAQLDEDPIDLFLRGLESEGMRLENVRRDIQELFPAFHWPWFFTQIGLTQELSFFSETFRRFEEKLLPPLQGPTEVLRLVNELYEGKSLEWLEGLKGPQLEKLLSAFTRTDFQLSEGLVQDLHLSLEILAQRLSGLGLDILIAKHLRDQSELHREFLELGRLSFTERDKSKALENLLFLNGLRGCEKAVGHIRRRSESTGISLALTYRLIQIEELIARLKLILNVLQASAGKDCHRKLGDFVKKVLLAHGENYKVGNFLGRNIEILAYQLTMLAERTGEHYISSNADELREMWWKAIKGAVIVALLVMIKTMASMVPWPVLFQALVFGSIYAIGFVIIHIIGGALATKQPAMTASTLAAAMDNVQNSDEAVNNLLEEVIRTLRTQVAALLGNFLFAFPSAVFFSFIFLMLGHPLIGYEKAQHMIEELHPTRSLSFLYAAMAGVCLFLSGMISGLADNWFAFNRIGDRLDRIFVGERSKKIITAAREQFGVVTGNIVLGYMLAALKPIGIITGLPMDTRHVTFSSGTLGMAWIHRDHMMPWSMFFMMILTVLGFGIINLTVSFSLSLFVAMKSRRLRFRHSRKLLWKLVKRLMTRPYELFVHTGK